mmetsp:Transcript_13774/g.17976  ORF Transcript_13774/g.17976 Transcript_13774/m.17976 type:complete len:222 (+) Transcript_13774:922-1587(+)
MPPPFHGRVCAQHLDTTNNNIDVSSRSQEFFFQPVPLFLSKNSGIFHLMTTPMRKQTDRQPSCQTRKAGTQRHPRVSRNTGYTMIVSMPPCIERNNFDLSSFFTAQCYRKVCPLTLLHGIRYINVQKIPKGPFAFHFVWQKRPIIIGAIIMIIPTTKHLNVILLYKLSITNCVVGFHSLIFSLQHLDGSDSSNWWVNGISCPQKNLWWGRLLLLLFGCCCR